MHKEVFFIQNYFSVQNSECELPGFAILVLLACRKGVFHSIPAGGLAARGSFQMI